MYIMLTFADPSLSFNVQRWYALHGEERHSTAQHSWTISGRTDPNISRGNNWHLDYNPGLFGLLMPTLSQYRVEFLVRFDLSTNGYPAIA